jgi:hypothetical protein
MGRRIDRLSQQSVKILKIGFGQMIKRLFYAGIFGALLFAWNVFFAGRSRCALCGSHRDTLALPNPKG